jgi:sugar O-acyltransferase (sialic acid O-acetyltransferase NeuD family)
MQRTILIGASGLVREVIASQQREGRYVGILDDDVATHGTTVAGVPVLGGLSLAGARNESLLICVGSGIARRSIVRRLALFGAGPDRYATHIADQATVGAGSRIGAGTILLAGVVVTADVVVGSHVVIMPNVVITHDDVVDDYATLAACVALGGSVHIGEAAYIGMNASVLPGLSVGVDATIGMGAAVLTPVPDGETWVGVPAHPVHHSYPRSARTTS